MHDVAITSTAVISAAGQGTHQVMASMVAGTTHVAHRTTARPTRPGGLTTSLWPVAAMRPSDVSWPPGHPWVDNKKYANLAANAAVTVARMATETVGGATPDDAFRSGTVMAIGTGSGDEHGEVMTQLAVKAQRDPRPLATLLYDEVPDYSYIKGIPSQVGQFVAMATGFRGSNVALYGEGGVSGLGSLALGLRLIRSGELDRVLVVGVTSPMATSMLAALDREDPLGTEVSVDRGPFAVDRSGTFPGEGAVAIMLERLGTARTRKSPTLALLSECEVYSAPSLSAAMAASTEVVLTASEATPDMWFAHGSGSTLLDAVECRTVGGRVRPPMTSSKGTIGNLFECGALVDVALAVRSLDQGWVPPVGLLKNPDPALGDVDIVVGVPRAVSRGRHALVTAFSSGISSSTAGSAVIARGTS